MTITRKAVAAKLEGYLHHRISLTQLVDWAEQAMMEGSFAAGDLRRVREIVARVGVADVRAFGLTWEDCEEFLRQLGYTARVEVAPVSVRKVAVVREKPAKYGR